MSSLQDWLIERWRRIKLEFSIELPLLKKRWVYILLGAAFQYCHGLGTQLAHRMHRPQAQPLHDVGFAILPELGLANEWVSESIFTTLFVSFMLWTFSPFVFMRKRFYTAVIWSRLLMVLVVCQSLRILSFSVTQLPAPNYHCRTPEPTAIKPMPEHWWGHFYIKNLSQQTTHGCGDLIFSSHTTFMLVGMLTYNEYGTLAPIKALAWAGVAVVSMLIVSSRKHYSVDVLIAWYVVPLVFYHMLRRWTTVRPAVPHWPHRPLAEAEVGPAGTKGVSGGSGAAELQQVLIVDGIARSTEMVAQKQALLSALPADDPLVAASQTQAQAALDKQVLLSEGELTDSEGDSNGSGGSVDAGGRARQSLARTSNGRGAAALMRSRSQAGLAPGSSPESDREGGAMLRRDHGGGLRGAPSTMLAPAGLGSRGCVIS